MGLRLQALQEADKFLGIPDHPGEKGASEEEAERRERRLGYCSQYLSRQCAHGTSLSVPLDWH